MSPGHSMGRRAMATIALLPLLLMGCHHKEITSATTGGDQAALPAVVFREGRGLQLPPEIRHSLGISKQDLQEQTLLSTLHVQANVFEEGLHPRALALLPMNASADLKRWSVSHAEILRINHELEAATRQTELIFSLENSDAKVGDKVDLELQAPSLKAMAAPRAAVIDGAQGPFVYVVNGDYYLRTQVKTGMTTSDWIEITDGLYPGDVLVVTGADRLWLTELQLTKGGGDND